MYKIFDHTADVGIEASGRTLEESFGEMAKGMFALITNGGVIGKKIVKRIEIPLKSDEELMLVDFLSELLYIHDVENLVFGDFNIEIDTSLTCDAYGEKFDREKHGIGTEIKAATYHMLEIKKNKKEVIIKVLFDI